MRAPKLDAIPPEALRQMLMGDHLVSQIQTILMYLMVGMRPEYQRRPTRGQALESVYQDDSFIWVDLTKEDIQRYDKALNGFLRLLTKVLPDLKAVEVNDVSERRQLSDVELATRVLGVLGAGRESRTH